ncbi:hypothetical protein NMY22_g18579 [Coprinellus aureogranulatus]|nr:hypothetical protein NMY22_g18579 [Coprinellus aureogranulatus]
MYTVYPTLIPRALTLIEENVLPVIDELPSDSHYKETFDAIHSSLQSMVKFVSPDQQERLCDSIFHSTRFESSQETADQTVKRDDWTAFHRAECGHMSVNYYDRKASKSWYSYSHRRFHANVMRYILESTEVAIRLSDPLEFLGYFSEPYRPASVVSRIILLKTLNFMRQQCKPEDLNTWVGKVAPLVPEHLRPRFDAFLYMFLSGVKAPDYAPGSLRLLESVFVFGEEDVTTIVLLNQSHPLPTPTESKEETATIAQRFAERGAGEQSHYQFVGSFSFIGNSRGRDNLGDPELPLGVGVDMSDFNSSTWGA